MSLIKISHIERGFASVRVSEPANMPMKMGEIANFRWQWKYCMHSTSSFSQRVRNTHVAHMARYSIEVYTKWKWSTRKKRDGLRKALENKSKKHTKAPWESGYYVSVFLFIPSQFESFGSVGFSFLLWIWKLELVNAFAHKVSVHHLHTLFRLSFAHTHFAVVEKSSIAFSFHFYCALFSLMFFFIVHISFTSTF